MICCFHKSTEHSEYLPHNVTLMRSPSTRPWPAVFCTEPISHQAKNYVESRNKFKGETFFHVSSEISKAYLNCSERNAFTSVCLETRALSMPGGLYLEKRDKTRRGIFPNLWHISPALSCVRIATIPTQPTSLSPNRPAFTVAMAIILFMER